MDTAADATLPLGAWASIRGYFTPATLFLVVNLVIGTIALTSRVSSHQRRRRDYRLLYDDGRHPHPEPLQPQPHQQEYHHHYYPHEQQQYATPPPPAPAPLARTSSVLDRLRSLGLYRFRSGDFPPEYAAAGASHAHDVFSPVVEEEATATATQAHYARSRSEPAPAPEEKRPAPRMKKLGSEARKAQVARAPALVVEAVAEDDGVDARADAFVGSFRPEAPPQQAAEHHYQQEYVPPAVPAPAPLARAPSVLERLCSLDFYGFLAPAQPTAAPAPARGGLAAPADEKKKQAAHYNRSRSDPTREEGKTEKKQQAAEARMAKSSSVARRKPAGPRLVEAEDCVDARAEAFIDSFRREYVAPTPAPPQKQEAHHDHDEHVAPPPPPLARTSSMLDRLRSFGHLFRSGDLGPEHPAGESTPAAADGKAHYGRSRSEPPQAKKEKKPQGAAEAKRMSKSSSESIVEEAAPEACVDARADDFINKFRQQLQLQRLNSLLNYKEMLTGGGKQQ
ncbi:hypothetical protein ACP4OV_020242 [Aristida adscensionis]